MAGCDRIHNYITMNPNKMFGIQDAIFVLCRIQVSISRKERKVILYLPGSINNFSGIVLALVFDYSTKCILDRGIVALNKVMVDESDCQ